MESTFPNETNSVWFIWKYYGTFSNSLPKNMVFKKRGNQIIQNRIYYCYYFVYISRAFRLLEAYQRFIRGFFIHQRLWWRYRNWLGNKMKKWKLVIVQFLFKYYEFPSSKCLMIMCVLMINFSLQIYIGMAN